MRVSGDFQRSDRQMAATAERMAATAEDTAPPPPAIVVGFDHSGHSFYALEWTLRHFFPGSRGGTRSPPPFRLVIVHAKPTPTSVVGLAGPATAHLLPSVESDLKSIAATVIQKAKEMCNAHSVGDVVYEVVEGDARNVLCLAVEKYHADILAVGSHGYGVIKRVVLGSVSDYCAHHAHCTVMIVKKPKSKHSSISPRP